MFTHGFNKDIQLNNGLITNGIGVSVERGTAPGFPLVVKVIQSKEQPINLQGLLRAARQNEYIEIPMIKRDGLLEE